MHTSANFDAPSQTIAEKIPDRSPEMLSTCKSRVLPDEILTTSNSTSRKLDSVHRSTPEIPGENSKWQIAADEIKSEISHENHKRQISANQLESKIPHEDPKKQVAANEVKSIVQNTEKSFSPSNLEQAPVKLINKDLTTENEADTQHKLPNSPSQPALGPSLHIARGHIFAKEVKSPDEKKTPSPVEKKNPSPDEKKNLRFDENEYSSAGEKKYPSQMNKVTLHQIKRRTLPRMRMKILRPQMRTKPMLS